MDEHECSGSTMQISQPGCVSTSKDHRAPTDVESVHRSCGVYTEAGVVSRILDAVGWKHDTTLSTASLLEPVAGNGQFVVEAARRFVASYRRGELGVTYASLKDRIVAFEIHSGSGLEVRLRKVVLLHRLGLKQRAAAVCAKTWIKNADFLLATTSNQRFTHAVGNPPYIRRSKIPSNLKNQYPRHRTREFTGGVLFLPFLNLALEQLRPGGKCGFICSDRWKYMAFADPFTRKWLSALEITSEEAVSANEAFIENVNTYPSIVIASKTSPKKPSRAPKSPSNRKTLKDLGYEIKFGPALGHTDAFVLGKHEQDVETNLHHPWVDSSEISECNIAWYERHVVSLFDDSGDLIELSNFPMLTEHLERFEKKLKNRTIVKNCATWYRTIDHVRESYWKPPKLVLTELVKPSRLAFDRSGRIPVHGVYAIFAPNGDIDTPYAQLRDGGLVRALIGIAPRIKGGYMRCYKRFLLNIRILTT